METQPLISIVVPVYNAERFLAEALDSLLNQSYPHFEVRIVDDGSQDTSKVIIAEYVRRDPRIKSVRVANGGQARARQIGISAAQGAYITFMDSDDLVHPDWLQTMLDAIQQPEVDVVVVNYYNYFSHTKVHFARPFHQKAFLIEGDEKYRYWLADDDFRGYLWNKLFDARLFHPALPIAPFNLLEDGFLLGQMLPRIRRIAFVDEPRYYYRFSVTSSVHAKFQSSDIEAIHHLGGLFLAVAREKPALTAMAVRRYAALSLFVLSKMSPRQLVAHFGYVQQLGMVLSQYTREFEDIVSHDDVSRLSVAPRQANVVTLRQKLTAWSHLLGLKTFEDLDQLQDDEDTDERFPAK